MAGKYTEAIRQFRLSLGPGWSVTEQFATALTWLLFRSERRSLPHQGWKIHISTSALDACQCITNVLPVLIDAQVTFKFPSSLAGIVTLNSGRLGLTQAGKIITVYPASDTDYGQLIAALQEVWPSTNGPQPLSDLLLGPDSSISLRFGAFTSESLLIDTAGGPECALVAPDGTRVPDRRAVDGMQPAWAPPCPVPCQFLQPQYAIPTSFRINECDYFPICILHDSAKGHVVLCTDRSLTPYVLKTARRGVFGDLDGADARSRLENEFHYLQRISHLRIAPQPLQLVSGNNAVALMSDMGGTPLDALGHTDRLRLMPALATVVARLHSEGIVHRDLKPQNVIAVGDSLHLVDFELASESNSDNSLIGGTDSYVRQQELAATSESRDVYALGMCVAQALLDYDPPLVPGGSTRIIQLLKGAGKHTGADLVKKLCQADVTARPTAAQAARMIEEALPHLVQEADRSYPSDPQRIPKRWIREASLAAGAATRRFRVQTAHGHHWRNGHFQPDFDCEAINIGASGIILGLLTLDTAYGTDHFSDDFEKGINHLAGKRPVGEAIGLFTGHAGIGLTLAIAGLRYRRDDLIEKAKRRVLGIPLDAPDLDFFTGLAGAAWTACLVGDLLGDSSLFSFADACVARLCDSAIDSDGLVCWEPSASFSEGSSMPFLGAAHGASGIAMALGFVGRHTNNDKARRLGMESLKRLWIRHQTSPGIPRRTGESPSPQQVGHWCHGTAGFVWSILQGFGDCDELSEPLQWAVNILQSSTWLGNPTYCHGVSGHLEMWRMLAAIDRYQSIALCRSRMALAALKNQQHRLGTHDLWSSEEPAIVTPDLWVGFLAPATALALQYAEAPCALLSLEWLSRCAKPT